MKEGESRGTVFYFALSLALSHLFNEFFQSSSKLSTLQYLDGQVKEEEVESDAVEMLLCPRLNSKVWTIH